MEQQQERQQEEEREQQQQTIVVRSDPHEAPSVVLDDTAKLDFAKEAQPHHHWPIEALGAPQIDSDAAPFYPLAELRVRAPQFSPLALPGYLLLSRDYFQQTYVYIYTYICMHICLYIDVYKCIDIDRYIRPTLRRSRCRATCCSRATTSSRRMYLYICMDLCLYIYVYIYVYI